MKKVLYASLLAFFLLSCEEAVEKIPRTTVVVSVGAAGPAIEALSNFLPEGLTITVPGDWDTLDIETAMAGVLVDATPCTTATVNISGNTLPYDTITGLYVPIDSSGLPLYLQLAPGDPVTVYSPEDTVTGTLPTCPGIVNLTAPESLAVNTDLALSWSYDSGTPDSVMISFKIPGRETYTKILGGSNLSYTIPGSQVDTTGIASVSVSSLVFDTGLSGATPGSFILYTKSDFAPVVIY